jgi:hypothetical protein
MKSGKVKRVLFLREMHIKFSVMNQYLHRQMYLIKYDLYQVLKPLHVSTPGCHPQGVIEQRNCLNKTNLVNNLFLVYLSISTCFGRLWPHHQEKKTVFMRHFVHVILTQVDILKL